MKNNIPFKELVTDLRFIGSVVITVVVTTLSVVNPIYQIRSDIQDVKRSVEVIQTNELVHIQEAIDENQTDIEKNRLRNIEISEKLTEIIIILGTVPKNAL